MGFANRAPRGLVDRLARFSRLKLLIPLKRSPHPPEYSARGVAIGTFWALTPLVGIQMPLVLVTWLIFKPLRDYQFSLVIAAAWTWLSNVFTLLPMYYTFYVTGQIFMGNYEDISGYATFVKTFKSAFSEGVGFWQATVELVALLALELGVSMSIGCIPYAIVGGVGSYYIALKYIQGRRRRILARRAKRAIKEGRAVGIDRPPPPPTA